MRIGNFTSEFGCCVGAVFAIAEKPAKRLKYQVKRDRRIGKSNLWFRDGIAVRQFGARAA